MFLVTRGKGRRRGKGIEMRYFWGAGGRYGSSMARIFGGLRMLRRVSI